MTRFKRYLLSTAMPRAMSAKQLTDLQQRLAVIALSWNAVMAAKRKVANGR